MAGGRQSRKGEKMERGPETSLEKAGQWQEGFLFLLDGSAKLRS